MPASEARELSPSPAEDRSPGRSPAATAAFLLLAALLVVGGETALRPFLPFADSDTPGILAHVAVAVNADLYPRDAGVFPGDSFSHYIPPYMSALRFLAKIAGSAWGGMLILFPFALAAVLAGLWLILREAGAGRWLTLPLVLAATAIRPSDGGEYWGMTAWVEPIARYLFLGPALIACVPLLRSWPNVSTRCGLLSLAAVGLLANIHPPSAVGWCLILGILVLFSEGPTRRRVLLMIAGGTLALLLAMPGVLAASRQAAPVASSVTPERYGEFVAHVVSTQPEMFPWDLLVEGRLPSRFLPGRESLWYALAAYLAGMAIWAAWHFRKTKRGQEPFLLHGGWSRLSWSLLVLLQLPFAFVLTRFRAVDLLPVALLYVLGAWREKEVSRVERLAGAFLAAVVGVTWCGSAGLRLLWQYGELPQLTALAFNFARVARFVYVPIWILVGLWAKKNLRRETALPMAAAFAAFLFPWRRSAALFLLLFLGVGGVELRARRKLRAVGAALLNAAVIIALAAGAVSCWKGFRAADPFGESSAMRSLCLWARTQTPTDALFYAPDRDRFSLNFRALSERSIVYTSKGTDPSRLRPQPPAEALAADTSWFDRPYDDSDPALLMERARFFRAEFAIVPAGFPKVPGCPTAYANKYYRVLGVSPPP